MNNKCETYNLINNKTGKIVGIAYIDKDWLYISVIEKYFNAFMEMGKTIKQRGEFDNINIESDKFIKIKNPDSTFIRAFKEESNLHFDIVFVKDKNKDN